MSRHNNGVRNEKPIEFTWLKCLRCGEIFPDYMRDKHPATCKGKPFSPVALKK